MSKRSCIVFLGMLMGVIASSCEMFEGDDGKTSTFRCRENTCLDTTTGLTWQNPGSEETMNWQEALTYCDTLSLNGLYDWTLPTLDELRSLVRGCPGTEPGGACEASGACLASTCRSEACQGCPSRGGPAADGCYWQEGLLGVCIDYWSSSSFEDDDFYAWGVRFNSGYIGSSGIGKDESTRRARCVRF